MDVKYICQYRFNEGEVCGQGSKKPEGCYIHWKRRQQPLCKQDGCERPMASEYGFCDWHVKKYHSNAYYHRKKLDKMFQNCQTPEAMRQALNRMKIPNAINWS